MYRSILVPLDGTSFGEAAIPHAVAIARQARVPLYLTHVHLPLMVPSGAEAAALPLIWLEAARKEKRHYLESLASGIAAREQVEVVPRVVDGGITAALVAEARECSADLIVMSTHGHVGMRRLWHHGVAEHLARHLPVPTMLIRVDDRAPAPSQQMDRPCEIRNILTLLDGSARSERILEHAAVLATVCEARLVLAGVSGGADRRAAEGRPGHSGVTELRAYLERIGARLAARGLSVATVLLEGDQTGDAVTRYIDDRVGDPAQRIDLVALDVADRHLMSRLLARDLGDDLLERCPVPILRTHSEAQATTAWSVGAPLAGARTAPRGPPDSAGRPQGPPLQ